MNQSEIANIPSSFGQNDTYLNNIDYTSKPVIRSFRLLKPFQPLKPYYICPIHRLLSVHNLLPLLERIENTRKFSIDTEVIDNELKTLNAIKIELLEVEKAESLILYLEILYLPSQATPLFSMLQILIKNIFLPCNKFYVWSKQNKQDLKALVFHQLLSSQTFHDITIIELQQSFKQWYNQAFKHNENCKVPSWYTNDSILCTCLYRPFHQLEDEWTLEMAMNYVFHETLINSNRVHIEDAYQKINNSVGHVLALTKLSMAVELNWTIEHINKYMRFHEGK